MLGWLDPFDVEGPNERRRVEVLKTVACGERRDYVWARLLPPLAPGAIAGEGILEVVLLAPRHAGYVLKSPLSEAVHVYVCSVPGVESELPDDVAPESVEVEFWGVVYPCGGNEPVSNEGTD